MRGEERKRERREYKRPHVNEGKNGSKKQLALMSSFKQEERGRKIKNRKWGEEEIKREMERFKSAKRGI